MSRPTYNKYCKINVSYNMKCNLEKTFDIQDTNRNTANRKAANMEYFIP